MAKYEVLLIKIEDAEDNLLGFVRKDTKITYKKLLLNKSKTKWEKIDGFKGTVTDLVMY